MRTICIYFLVVSLLFSCGKKEDPSLLYSNQILGLASPIIMQENGVELYLEDYFIYPEKVDSLRLPEGLSIISSENNIVKISGELSLPIASISAFFGDTILSIPIKANRKLEYTFKLPFDESYKALNLKGNFNGWNSKASPMTFENGEWIYKKWLFPGEYQYLVVIEEKEMLDPFNSDSADNGTGGFNSKVIVGDPNAKTPFIFASNLTKNGFKVISDSELKSAMVLWENLELKNIDIDADQKSLNIKIPEIAKTMKRSHIRIWAYDEIGLSNDMLIPLEYGEVVMSTEQLTREDKHNFRMYFLMVDRFFNGNKANDRPVDDPDIMPQANYLGGDIAGVTEKVKEGYFNDLYMNTVWLSPIGTNPEGAWGLWDKGGVKSKFSGFHGYWPAESKTVDNRMGSPEELKELIEASHSKGDNVLLDYVANHVHQDHPVYRQHPDWATNLYLPDGTMNTEKWDEYRLTTWFDTHLPTLDLENPIVAEAMSDSALYWFQTYDIDGFRHDATKHIPESFWRTLTRKLKLQVMLPENRFIYQIGETYGNAELIGSYVSSGQMDAQFDFNMYDKTIQTLSKEENKMSDLMATLNESLTFYGYHNLMGYISGNQDRPRFISLADGSVSFAEDSKLAGWTRDIENKGKIGFERLAQLHAFNFTIPGIPVIYYGDEIGMPGGNDPDNRRMMIFDNLNEDQLWLKETVTKLGEMRKNNLALIYGDLKVISADNSTLVFERKYFDKKVIVLFNNSSEEKSMTIPDAINLKSNFGSAKNDENSSIAVKAHGFEILSN